MQDAKSIIKLIEERTDYRNHGPWFQSGQLSNGAFTSSLLNFLDDNPGAVEVLEEFIEKHFPLQEEEEEEGAEEESE